MITTTQRTANSVILLKLETTSGTDASPTASADAIEFELDSVSFNSPYKLLDSNAVTGSYVSGAPTVVGQAATFSFKSRIKGSNATYTSTAKPPHHQALSACGKRGYFQAAIATAVATAGTTTSITLGTGFSTTAQGYRGMPLVLTADSNAGDVPFVTDYTTGKVATITDTLGTAASTSTSVAIPANWTYAGTSPKDATAAATDQPSATIYYFEDGDLLKFTGCRGTVDIDITSGEVGYFTFNFTGIFVSKTDASVPTGVVIASQSAPLLLQQNSIAEAVVVNRKALPVSTVKISDGASIDTPDDPNSVSGFGPATLGARSPQITIDPLADLVANRNTLSEIANGTQYSSVFRVGSVAGNRYAITAPVAQPVSSTPGAKNGLRSEEIGLRLLNTATQDAQNRDGDYIICFY